jgi:diadenylate cyclase
VIDALQTAFDILRRIDSRDALDILLVAGVIYWLLRWLRGTSAMSLLRGIAIVAAVWLVLGNLFNLTVVNWLLRNSLTALLIAMPIIFQPELRRALERVGRTGMRSWRGRGPEHGLNSAVVAVARQCSNLRFGALIVVERETGLEDYVDTGVRLEALPSVPLLMAIFFPGAPLHDGAVILREQRVAAAGCTLPLSEPDVALALGTRHRAALGISERTDAFAVVVSEETGEISLAANGKLLRRLSEDQLLLLLNGPSERAPSNAAVEDAPAGGLLEPAASGEIVRIP